MRAEVGGREQCASPQRSNKFRELLEAPANLFATTPPNNSSAPAGMGNKTADEGRIAGSQSGSARSSNDDLLRRCACDECIRRFFVHRKMSIRDHFLHHAMRFYN
jgi:hypothetical protein